MIVIGSIEDYVERHPGPQDITCVIEVADASLRRDRTTKLRAYAKTGIEPYFIVNLLDRVLEVYSRPLRKKGEYGDMTPLTGRQSVKLPAGGGKHLTMPAKYFLP